MEFSYPPGPITLSGKYVDLFPLHESHLPALTEAAKDGELLEAVVHRSALASSDGNMVSKSNGRTGKETGSSLCRENESRQ